MNTPSEAVTTVLVLGGNGFVGSKLCKYASHHGCKVVSVSRRGPGEPTEMKGSNKTIGNNIAPSDVLRMADESGPKEDETESDNVITNSSPGIGSVKHVIADAGDVAQMTKVFEEHGPFNAVVHSIGVLYDNKSTLRFLNEYASGSGSAATHENDTYDRSIRESSFIAIDLSMKMMKHLHSLNLHPSACPFIFISASEASWTIQSPLPYVERYLEAKRKVERQLSHASIKEYLRPIIVRPSKIYTSERPLASLTAIPNFIGSFFNLPYVDKPVHLNTLVCAILQSINDTNCAGVKESVEIEQLASQYLPGSDNIEEG